jgi:tetratricopeptide (TPR) repeat protein
MSDLPELSDRKKRKLARKVGNLVRRGSGELAIKVLEDVLAKAPQDHYLIYLLGWTYEKLRRNNEALEMYSRAEVLSPNGDPLKVTICELLLHIGQPAKALPYAEEIVRIWPKSSEAHSLLGKSLLELGRSAEAEASLENSVRLSGLNPDARAELVRLYQVSGREHLIRPLLEAYAKSAPDLASSQAFLADFLSNDLGEYATALPLYEKALSLYEHSNNPSWFAQYFSTRGYPDWIIYEYLDALEELGMEDVAIRMAANQLARRRFDQFQARQLERIGQVDQAIRKLTQAIEAEPDEYPSRNRLAGLLLRKGELEEAESQARRSIEDARASSDNDPWLLPPLIVSLERQGKQTEADTLRQGVPDRDQERMKVALVDLYARLNDWEQVVSVSQELLAKNNKIPPVVMRLGEALMATGDHEAAIERYRSLLAIQPNNPNLRLALAKAQIQAHDLRSARQSLEHALRAAPPSSSLRDEAGRLLKGLDDPAGRDNI